MPLIIHRESCCDVCLEPFTYEAPRPPHAIPCGHIFCRECLHSVNPTICPLCRKPFLPERAKKLITGETTEARGDKEGLELLERLVVLWDVDRENEELTALLEEIQTWLNNGNRSDALVKAQEVMTGIVALKAERAENQRALRRLRKDIHHKELRQSERSNTVAATEESLRERVRELENLNSLYEEDVMRLQIALASLPRHPVAPQEQDIYPPVHNNPLPPPPEPLRWRDSRGTVDHQINGLAGPSTSNSGWTNSLLLSNGPRRSPTPDEVLPMNGSSRKGKEKARDSEQPHSYSVYGPASWGSQMAEGQGESISSSSAPLNLAIIPGAPPDRRFRPSRSPLIESHHPPTQDVTQEYDEPVRATALPSPWSEHGHGGSESEPDAYALIEEYIVNGYTTGFGSGYRLASERTDSHASETGQSLPWSVRSPTSSSITASPPLPPMREHTPQLPTILHEPRPVPLNATLPSSPAFPVPQPTHTTSSREFYSAEAPPRSVPPTSTALRIPFSSPTTAPPPAPSSRRRVTQPVAPQHTGEAAAGTYVASSLTERLPSARRQSASAVPRSATQTRDEHRTSLASLSSWGTVNTMNPISPSRLPITEDMLFQRPEEIRSIRDLRLNSFGDPGVGGQRTSIAYSIESLTTGVEAVQLVPENSANHYRNQQQQQHTQEPRNGSGLRDNTTPRVRTTSLRSPASSSASSQGTIRAQHYQNRRQGVHSVFSQPVSSDGLHMLTEPMGASLQPQPQPQAPSSRTRHQHRRHGSSLSQEIMAATPSATRGTPSEENSYDGSEEDAADNALGLSHMTRSPRISAPTPRLAEGVFVRSLSGDGWWS